MAGSALMAQGIDKRRHILRFIKAYSRKHGFSPTVEEIAAELGVASKNAVRYHLAILIEEGFVAQQTRKHRSLQVLDEGRYPRRGGR